MARLSRPSAAPLPSYQLYGERLPAQLAERLHIETIDARSRLHDWEIQPHRHPNYFQILHLGAGRAEAFVDGAEWPLVGPGAVLVPAMVAHGFRFEPGVQGHVITVQQGHLADLLAREADWWPIFARPERLALQRQGGAARRLAAAVQGLADEYAGAAAWRAAAIDAALLQLMLALGRALPGPAATAGAPAGGRASEHLARYRALVEARFHLQPRVADLAAELGLSPTHLNRLCQSQAGQSALGLLHGRLVLEAQRQLAYTTQSIKRIALDLGFADAGYFSRFFLRLCGRTPSAWRVQVRRQGSSFSPD